MKLPALLVGGTAAFVLAGGVWLLYRTLRFFLGPDYAPFSGAANTASGGLVFGLLSEGLGIFVPAGLLLALAAFLWKWASNLWNSQ